MVKFGWMTYTGWRAVYKPCSLSTDQYQQISTKQDFKMSFNLIAAEELHAASTKENFGAVNAKAGNELANVYHEARAANVVVSASACPAADASGPNDKPLPRGCKIRRRCRDLFCNNPRRTSQSVLLHTIGMISDLIIYPNFMPSQTLIHSLLRISDLIQMFGGSHLICA